MSYKYNAFISYSHAADGKLAPKLQVALEKFAKPGAMAGQPYNTKTASALAFNSKGHQPNNSAFLLSVGSSGNRDLAV